MAILSIVALSQNDLLPMFNYEKRKREIARKYLYDIKHSRLYKQLNDILDYTYKQIYILAFYDQKL